VTESKKAVFLSYASQDSEAARHIADMLRSAGVDVWFDQSELRGGDAWDRQISKQIRDCALFIAIISTHTEARSEGYFRREWRVAVDRTRDMADDQAFLLPVVIDATPDATARVPDKFRELQWTRMPDGATSPAFVERVSRLLSPGGQDGVPAGASPVPSSGPVSTRAASTEATPKPTAPWRSRPALLVMVAAVVIVVGYFTVDKLWLSKRPTPGAASARAVQPASPGQSATPEKSIAVLAFIDMSEKKDQEYFADGMAAEVLDLLAKIPGLKVIGRTSSFQFKGKTDDLRSIGAKLGAAYLVEGSVRKSGDNVRVTAQLIDARDGAQRWSSTYDRKSSDVLEVQDAIAGNLARALQLTVSTDFRARASASSAEAYDVYLRGLHAFDQLSKEGTEEATGDFQQALNLDPAFAPAALGLAKAYQFTGELGWSPTRVAFERARHAVDLAIKLDPNLGAAHAVRADILVINDWDWAGAGLEITQALKLGGRAEAIPASARLAAARGEWDQATQLFATSIAGDPLNANLHVLLAWGVDLRSRRFAEAESSMRRALYISPNYGAGRWFLGLSLLFQDRLDEALAVMQQETLDDGQLEGTAIVYHAMQRKSDSDAALKRAIDHNADSWPSAIARAYAFRGERDQAMKWLERAYAGKDEDLYFIKGDPLMRNLEGDPRYKAFLRKMNLPE
jgi:TolB-like protein